jgi:hypothetical protein
MFCPTILAFIVLQKTMHLNKQPECITIYRNRNCDCETIHKTMDELQATKADNIIEGELAMSSPLWLP